MNAYTAHECTYGPDRNARKPGAEQSAPPRGLVLRENGGSGEGGKQEPAPAGASRGGWPGPLARLGRDTRAAIGIPGVLVAAMLVGATALPVANITLNADSKRMEDAATAAGLAATGKMRAEGVSVSAEVLRREAERYARLNLLDLPAGRPAQGAGEPADTHDERPGQSGVQVDLEATPPRAEDRAGPDGCAGHGQGGPVGEDQRKEPGPMRLGQGGARARPRHDGQHGRPVGAGRCALERKPVPVRHDVGRGRGDGRQHPAPVLGPRAQGRDRPLGEQRQGPGRAGKPLEEQRLDRREPVRPAGSGSEASRRSSGADASKTG